MDLHLAAAPDVDDQYFDDEKDRPAFYDADEFDFVAALRAAHADICDEFRALELARLQPWPERNLYTKDAEEGVGWDVFGLYAFGKRNEANCALCPKTAAVVEQFEVTTAAFSVLTTDTHIVPHSGYGGYSNFVLRCHLGLQIPEYESGATVPIGDDPPVDRPLLGLRVANEVRSWTEGDCLVFDDSHIHEAWNFTDSPRVVLLMDFKRPEKYVRTKTKQCQVDYLDELTAAHGF